MRHFWAATQAPEEGAKGSRAADGAESQGRRRRGGFQSRRWRRMPGPQMAQNPRPQTAQTIPPQTAQRFPGRGETGIPESSTDQPLGDETIKSVSKVA